MADTATASSEGTTPPQLEKGWPALKHQIIQDKIKVAQLVLRLITILFTFQYLIPIFGWVLDDHNHVVCVYGLRFSDKFGFVRVFRNPYDAYYKVLLSCTATNILRLHQRLPRVTFTREFLQTLFLEDSFHYLFYTSIFQYTPPVTRMFLWKVVSWILSFFFLTRISKKRNDLFFQWSLFRYSSLPYGIRQTTPWRFSTWVNLQLVTDYSHPCVIPV